MPAWVILEKTNLIGGSAAMFRWGARAPEQPGSERAGAQDSYEERPALLRLRGG
jgi:hypothetical protein